MGLWQDVDQAAAQTWSHILAFPLSRVDVAGRMAGKPDDIVECRMGTGMRADSLSASYKCLIT